jgi:hypothetical protein
MPFTVAAVTGIFTPVDKTVLRIFLLTVLAAALVTDAGGLTCSCRIVSELVFGARHFYWVVRLLLFRVRRCFFFCGCFRFGLRHCPWSPSRLPFLLLCEFSWPVFFLRLQYSLAVFVGFLYSSLAVPGLYYFLEYSRLAGKYSRVTSKRKNINKFKAALLGWRVGSEAGFENHLESTRYNVRDDSRNFSKLLAKTSGFGFSCSPSRHSSIMPLRRS